MNRIILHSGVAAAVLVSASLFGGHQVRAAEEEKGETDPETERYKAEAARYKEEANAITERAARDKARLDALGLPKFDGKQTINEGAVAVESWLLTATAIDGAANHIHTAIAPVPALMDNPANPGKSRNILVLAGAETLDFSPLSMMRTEMTAIAKQLTTACGCTATSVQEMVSPSMIMGVITAAAGLLKSDTELTAVGVTVDSKTVAAAVAGRFDKAVIPSAAIGPDINSKVTDSFDELARLADSARRERDKLAKATAKVKDAKDPRKVRMAAIDAALARYDGFFTRATSPSTAGPIPLGVAARLDQLTANNPIVLRVIVEKSGGTLVKRTNIVTMLGGEAVKISGGLVVSYQLTELNNGMMRKAGTVTCRTVLTTLQRVQDASWRTQPPKAKTRTAGKPEALCTA